jgi:hypothetical protein
VVVSEFFMDRPRSEGANIGQLAVDETEGPFKDRLYAVWPDAREGRVQVLLSYSSDKGTTWSKPLVVNDDRPPPGAEKPKDHILPAVAVNNRGIVAVSWYDRRESEDNLGWRVRMAASFDGGETFTASVPVSSEPNSYDGDVRWPMDSRASIDSANAVLSMSLGLDLFFESGGHTTGLVADANGIFHPVWVDNRTGVSQIWTAPVRIRGQAIENGSTDLAGLQNLSKSVAMELTQHAYDRSDNTITVSARLKNISEDTISSPLRLRVIRLESEMGFPEILDADNGKKGIGAVWDLTPLLPRGRLLPDSLSTSRELRFHLRDPQPLRSGREYKGTRMITLEVRVLGQSIGSPSGT